MNTRSRLTEPLTNRPEASRPEESVPLIMPASPALRRAVAATQSGLKRYPRELIASVKERARTRAAIEPATDLAQFAGDDLGAFWIGHATVLLRMGGSTILTDPVFSERVGMAIGGVTFGVARVRPPAADVQHLPKIDAILLSHAHFDHFDKPSLRALALGPARGATVVTSLHTRRLLPQGFGEVVELPWDHSARVGSMHVTALKPAHWGARAALDRHRRFNSYLIESGSERVFFAGDTAATDAFDRVGNTDLSIFGIGAYDPWEHAHATPEQVWKMYTGMHGGRAHGAILPMHHSTFVLGREPLEEPLKRLAAAAGADAGRIVASMPGGVWTRKMASGLGNGPSLV